MYEYIYGKDDSRFQFFKMPMSLFSGELLTALSNEAKLLYGLLLDRTGLSAEHNWTDENGRVYIHFTNAEVCKTLRIGMQKAVKLFRELTAAGLIERIRIGLGKPDKIFVKQCCPASSAEKGEETQPGSSVNTEEIPPSGSTEIIAQDIPASSVFPMNNQTNRFRENQSDPSYPVRLKQNEKIQKKKSISYREYREIIKENIEYDWFTEGYAAHENISGSQEELDGMVELMTECVCAERPMRIHGQEMPAEIVRSRFLKLTSEHIEYVFDCLSKTRTKISNIRAYLMTALYNAPVTMGSYYSTLTRCQMAQ